MKFSILFMFIVLNTLIAIGQTNQLGDIIDRDSLEMELGMIRCDSLKSCYEHGVSLIENGNFPEGKSLLLDILSTPDAKWGMGGIRKIRHNSAIQIYKGYKQQKAYDSALHWLFLSDTVYYLSNGCGNCNLSDWAESNSNFMALFELTGNYKETERLLLETAIINFRQDTFKNLRKIREIFIEHEDIHGLKRKFDKAITQYYSRASNSTPRRFYYFRYFIFLGSKMYTEPPWYSNTNNTNEQKLAKQQLISKIKTTAFYKMLVDLEKS